MKLNIQSNLQMLLPRDPVTEMEATTKGYVDFGLYNHSQRDDLHLTSNQNSWLDAVTVTSSEVNYLSGTNSSVQTQLNSKIAAAGGTMTGSLILKGDPVGPKEAATKDYVDNLSSSGIGSNGGTLTGYLILHANPISSMHAATKKYVDDGISTHADLTNLHLTSNQNNWLDAVTVTSSEVNSLEGILSSVQEQLNERVAITGATMTGALTLNAEPVTSLHAATKKYVDDGLVLKLSKTGGTVSGQIKTPMDPEANEDLSRKGYVDQKVQDHANSNSLHISPGQNNWLDAITVSAQEVNYLSGLASSAQSQLDSKFDKTGGTVSGDITLAVNKSVFVSKTPQSGNELVNKAYVDSKIKGQEWKDPVSASNVVSDVLSSPPVSPLHGDLYIVSSLASGAWSGMEGCALMYDTDHWVQLKSTSISIGDRFGICLTSSSTPGGNFSALKHKIATLISGTPGNYIWDIEDVTPGSSVLVFDQQSIDFGFTYTFTDELIWVVTNTSVNLTSGDAISITGNSINVLTGGGLTVTNNQISHNLDPSGGLKIQSSQLRLKINEDQLKIAAGGLGLSDEVSDKLLDALSRSGVSSVTGKVSFSTGADLTLADLPVQATDAVNKQFVDNVKSSLQGNIDTLTNLVNFLTFDSVTGEYVDLETAKKVSKTGDVMTGFLTLNANPTAGLHASSKSYVDSVIETHSTNNNIHVTSGQKSLLNNLSVTYTEINELDGITDNVQLQIDGKLSKAGGTMTGELLLSADASSQLAPTTKRQVDDGLALKLNKTGGSLTGYLTLHSAPVSDLHSATKKYVDDQIGSHVQDSDVHMTTAQGQWISAILSTSTEINYLQGVTSSVQTQIAGKLSLSGGTMTGGLVLNAAPSIGLHAATKTYVDGLSNSKLNLSGGAMTNFIELHADPTEDSHASSKGYVDGQFTALKTYTDNNKVSKAGSTLTGYLTLHAAPVSDLHPATKKYVDDAVNSVNDGVNGDLNTLFDNVNSLQGSVDGLLVDSVTKFYVDSQDNTRLAKAGGSVSGFLTLHSDPIDPMHPATKQYVDAIAQGLITKPSVRFATTGNLTAGYNNGSSGVNAFLISTGNVVLTVDSGTPFVGDRILVRAQIAAEQNGVYVVQQTGSAVSSYILKRVILQDESSEVSGSYHYVYDGATLKGTGWVLTVDNPVSFVIGTDSIIVNQFSGQSSITAGSGLTLTGNDIKVGTASVNRIVVNNDDIDLATTGVTPGTYNKVQVDSYGRVTGASNPNTLAGYGIIDAQPLNDNLTSASSLNDTGVIVRTLVGNIKTRKLSTSGVGLSVNTDGSGNSETNLIITSNATSSSGSSTIVSRDASGNFEANVITANLQGNSSTATSLKTSRTISVTGDIEASGISFNGTSSVELIASLSETSVVPGVYTKVTVDAKGRITFGQNPTTLSGYGITDSVSLQYVNDKIAELQEKFEQLQAYVASHL